jgi:ribosomal protein S19E (S16A)
MLIIIIVIIRCRVSPEESRDEGAGASKRRGKSAPHTSAGSEVISRHIMGKIEQDGGVMSPPDPLEPWSTRDIKSINNILDTSDRE